MRRRLSWRNERSMYQRTCSVSGKTIFSMYPSDTIFPVIDPAIFYGDDWHAGDYGRAIDFNRPFFEQWHDLQKVVPHMAVHVIGNENCDFVNHVGYCKDMYLCVGASSSEKCAYSERIRGCNHVYDCTNIAEGSNIYQCINGANMHNSMYCRDCSTCQDCILCIDCHNCTNCLFSQ